MKVNLPLPPEPTHFIIGRVYRCKLKYDIYIRTNTAKLISLSTGYEYKTVTSDALLYNFEDITEQIEVRYKEEEKNET